MRRILIALCLTIVATTARADIDIKEVTSPGGINAWVVEEPEIPFVALELRFQGGPVLDLPGKRGATNLMVGLLEEGSGDMSAQEFQAKLEELAASISFRATDDTISVSARFLTENKEDVVALLRQALVEPRFDQEALDRVRAQVISGIASDAKSPNTIASDTFSAAAYGDHPYGSAIEGTIESVGNLTQDDMRDAHRNALVRDRLYVAVVGDTTAETVGGLLDDLLGDLPQDGPPLPENITYDMAGGITVVDFDTPQSVALFGHGGMKRDDEDFFAAVIVNRVLGAGGFESRLMTEVREKRGLTYGISSFLVPRFHAEVMLGRVASSNETIAEAIEVTRSEWARMAEDGITAEELEVAKTYMTGEYPLRFDGNAEIAKIMVGMQMIGLTPEYVTNRNDFVEAVTLEDANRVAAELLQPENLHFVVVGKPVGLENTPSE
ncbi:M16 family metallopeptidase [Roseobacter sp. CCS2]|uniref:M16 family metallopeptidase n=1 Tax=Roseobacter sp. CCS2 TaxID=391593 RepID=UPI0000F3F168|nr:pitrilysin family protein [Roseobacter sp. CCS2]EBA11275.1 peptidase, M16 family, putative [Roseobacter sp. CCS2]